MKPQPLLFSIFALLCLPGCDDKNNSEVRANIRVKIPKSAADTYLAKYNLPEKSKSGLELMGLHWGVERFVIDQRLDPSDVTMELVAKGQDARSYRRQPKGNAANEASKALDDFLEADGKLVMTKYNFPE